MHAYLRISWRSWNQNLKQLLKSQVCHRSCHNHSAYWWHDQTGITGGAWQVISRCCAGWRTLSCSFCALFICHAITIYRHPLPWLCSSVFRVCSWLFIVVLCGLSKSVLAFWTLVKHSCLKDKCWSRNGPGLWSGHTAKTSFYLLVWLTFSPWFGNWYLTVAVGLDLGKDGVSNNVYTVSGPVIEESIWCFCKWELSRNVWIFDALFKLYSCFAW